MFKHPTIKFLALSIIFGTPVISEVNFPRYDYSNPNFPRTRVYPNKVYAYQEPAVPNSSEGQNQTESGWFGGSLAGVLQSLQEGASTAVTNVKNVWNSIVYHPSISCENCVAIKGLPGCLKLEAPQGTVLQRPSEICLTVDITLRIMDLFDVDATIYMGAPMTPLTVFRGEVMDTCKVLPSAVEVKSTQVCGCQTDLCNKYENIFGQRFLV